ncbi:MAG: transposase [Candidatus Methylomirabilales bacterium]
MALWIPWFRCVSQLRPACARHRTFLWMMVALLGFSVRAELAGVTTFVRAAFLRPALYRRLLHLFHTPALRLEALTSLWIRLLPRLFRPLRVHGRLVLVGDGLKVGKEGRKMPAVKKLHQESADNSKPEFIFGHSFQALGMLVRGPRGHVSCVPVTSRIHEGLVFSNAHRRTLLDKFVQLFLLVAAPLEGPLLLLADAFFATGKVLRPLLHDGHHLLTRVRSTAVAYELPPQPAKRRRGRPRLYGAKVRLRDLWARTEPFRAAPSPVYGEKGIEIRYLAVDLLWRPVGQLVRFVLVEHPSRGHLILMTSDRSLEPLDVLALYGLRFKIEVGFKQAIHTLGTYAYHFWMQDMVPLARKSGNQYLHRKSEAYRAQVRRKMDAYHRYVQLGCIAQGIQQHLALRSPSKVWGSFRSWMRTMKPGHPPSEAVVAQALRNTLPEFLIAAPEDQ